MNSCEWQETVLLYLEGSGDGPAGEHLRRCPECTLLAEALAEDARRLRMEPAEAKAVDYGAIRAGARREAVRRTRRRRWLVALAAAAAVLLAIRLVPQREVEPRLPPPQPIARAVTPAPPAIAPQPIRKARLHPRKRTPRPDPDREIDREFAAYLRALDEARQPAPPVEAAPGVIRIATSNPNVEIWLQEPKGNDHE